MKKYIIMLMLMIVLFVFCGCEDNGTFCSEYEVTVTDLTGNVIRSFKQYYLYTGVKDGAFYGYIPNVPDADYISGGVVSALQTGNYKYIKEGKPQ